jgi:hypothetical protein
MLLRSELLGCQCPSPISPDKATQLEQMRGASSPSKKILRFKSGAHQAQSAGLLGSSIGAGSGGGGGLTDTKHTAPLPALVPPAPQVCLASSGCHTEAAAVAVTNTPIPPQTISRH